MEIDDLSTVLGRAWQSFWPREHHDKVDAAVAAARAGGAGSFKARCPTAKGTLKWWDVVVTRVPGLADHPGAMLAISRDVTAAREAEIKLKTSEARFRSLALASSSLVWHCAPGARFDGEQPAWSAFTGQRFDDYRGAGWLAAVHPDDRIPTMEAWQRAERAGEVLQLAQRLRRADGEYRHMSMRCVPILDDHGHVAEWIGTHLDVTEEIRGRAERDALHDTIEADRARLRLATEAAQLGLWNWSPAEDVVHWENERCYDMFGLARGDQPITAERFIAEFLHPDDAERFGRCVADTLDLKADFAFAGRIFRADGEMRWVEFFGKLRGAAHGLPAQIVGTVSDITARKRTDMELYTSRERFEKIVNQAAIGVVLMDTQGGITFVNRKYADMLGYTQDELVGRSVIEITAADSLGKTLDTVATVLRDGSDAVIDKHYVRKDGTLMPATSGVNVLRGPTGANQGVVAIVLDTSERERTMAALRASEERYRTLFESMDQGFCIIDMICDAAGKPVDYRFVEMNRMFEHHTGLAGATGKTAKELVPTLDDFWVDTYGRVALTGEAVRFESEAAAMGRWYDVYATRIGDPGARRVALLFSDISARKRAEETLRRLADDLSESDRRKTEFLAMLAHELRNPLAPIRSGLAVMRVSGDNADTVARVRAIMERQVGQMVHLIDDLLDVARINGGKLELKKTHADLNQVLAVAVETSMPMIQAGHHDLRVDLPRERLMADVDVTRIAQVVANLLNNAAKYTPAGGWIRLDMRRDGDSAQLTVADSGIGIEAESLPGVFDMFSQVGEHRDRAQGGLGIGLSLVRSLVEMHGGSVAAASGGAGQGSTFSVRLPLSSHGENRDGRAHDPGAGACAAGGALELLVVDDNADAAATLAMLLELQGHQVRVAHDGIQALAAVEARAPQVVFLDIGMPNLDGYDTAKAMRRNPALDGTWLVALTGWGTEDDRAMARAAGFDDHLTKPVHAADIERILATARSAA